VRVLDAEKSASADGDDAAAAAADNSPAHGAVQTASSCR